MNRLGARNVASTFLRQFYFYFIILKLKWCEFQYSVLLPEFSIAIGSVRVRPQCYFAKNVSTSFAECFVSICLDRNSGVPKSLRQPAVPWSHEQQQAGNSPCSCECYWLSATLPAADSMRVAPSLHARAPAFVGILDDKLWERRAVSASSWYPHIPAVAIKSEPTYLA